MLPDYTRAKTELHELLIKHLRKRVRSLLGPFGEVPESRIFEGRRMATKTDGGKVFESEFQEHSGKLTISHEDIKSGNPDIIFEKLEIMARQMADSQSRAIFGELGRICNEAGQTIDFKGQRFGPEALLEVLKKVARDFDRDGKANSLTCFIPPNLEDRAKEAMEELQSNPVWKKRFEEMMETKRMEWRDRETSRKLVG